MKKRKQPSRKPVVVPATKPAPPAIKGASSCDLNLEGFSLRLALIDEAIKLVLGDPNWPTSEAKIRAMNFSFVKAQICSINGGVSALAGRLQNFFTPPPPSITLYVR